MIEDTRLRELVVEAYRDVELNVPLATIESAAARSRPRALAAAAASVLVVVLGFGLYLSGRGLVVGPVGAATATPWMPNSCVTLIVVASQPRPTAPPPLRIVETLDGVAVELYADDTREFVCFRLPRDAYPPAGFVGRNKMILREGELSNYTFLTTAGGVTVGHSFGRMPSGATKVEIRLADGGTVAARLAGRWYLAAATGDAGRRLATATSVVATVHDRTYTIPVQ